MSLMPVDHAMRTMRDSVEPIAQTEALPLLEARGRVLAEVIVAERDQPPFDASAMDGYAVRAADLPGSMRRIGEAAAGRRFPGTVGPSQCCRIFTGAPLPEGADAVLIQEDASVAGDTVSTGETLAPGRYVRPAGLDYRAGSTLLSPGRRLGPTEIALVASVGRPEVRVVRRPRVAIVMSGDELVEPGGTPGPDAIFASNGSGVAVMVAEHGGEPLDFGIAADCDAALDALFDRVETAKPDVVVTLGGASVGDHDLVGSALERRGVDMRFLKLAMRPGKPVMFGIRGPVAYLGLPGNPVSSLVGARILLVPLLDRLLGAACIATTETAILAEPLERNGPRRHYMRAELKGGRVAPFPDQDSSLLSVLARTDVLVVRDPYDPPRSSGESVRIMRW